MTAQQLNDNQFAGLQLVREELQQVPGPCALSARCAGRSAFRPFSGVR